MVEKRLNFCFVKAWLPTWKLANITEGRSVLQSEKFFSSRVDELVKAMYIPSDSKQIEEK